ncbi:MAG: peptidylprolyl isomerase [Candidatus Sumerlaeia bacterium]|nr:peptidylprolyl isomerase [Candidatus Sumerlaeia bacterium]
MFARQSHREKSGRRSFCRKEAGIAALLGVALGLLAPAFFAAARSGPRVLDRVAARVNQEIITEKELLQAAFGEVPLTATVPQGTVAELRSVLNAMIEERLLAQAAREEIKEIPEEVIANRVEAIVKEQKEMFSSESAFLSALERRGWDLEAYKAHLRDRETRAYVTQAALARRVRITENDVTSYTEQLKRRGAPLVEYRLAHILVRLPDTPTASDIQQADRRILQYLEQLRQGTPFATLAREQSDDKAARQTGGDLGWLGGNTLQKPILEAVASLERGQISAPVRTEKGIHIFQLIRKRTPREMLFEKRLEEVRKSWAADLRRRGHVKILLPQLSE